MKAGVQNVLLRILPALWQEQSGEWLSPWQMLLGGQGSPQSQELVEQWQHMASAYGQADAAAWTTAVAAAQALLPPDLNWRLWAELWQGRLHLLDGVTLLLAVAAGLALAGRNRAAFLAHSLACLALLGAIGLRIYILQRPPVGTLYESILFVALIVALGAVLMRQWLVSAALGGFILMLVAALLQGEGDNMGMLTAVLNTNFWLTVHVLCITAGYGACLLTALWAHLLLWRGGAFMAAPERGDMLRHLSLASLLLTAIGTLLGGVWADQSWGRFWGWDPKENGALVIVLWLLWLQHGRMAGLIGQLAFTAGMAALGVVVALAWFGVNLLGTGLHSYGFITGVATGLALYSGANLALIGVLWWRARQGQLYVA